MSEKTKISWCDSTINFWRGCDKVSPGCTHCYITRAVPFRVSGQKHGDPRVLSENAFRLAEKLNRKPLICSYCGTSYADGMEEGKFPVCHACLERFDDSDLYRRRIFSLSLGDWLDDKVPYEWLARMLDTIRRCDKVTWILCSKRWENFGRRIIVASGKMLPDNPDGSKWAHDWWCGKGIPKNIIGLCSVEDQQRLNERYIEFLEVPLACHGLSIEPLLGPIVLTEEALCQYPKCGHARLGWLIIGGESGPMARPCNLDWIRSLRNQGFAADVPVYVKQLGAQATLDLSDCIPESNDTDEDVEACDIAAWENYRHNVPIRLKDPAGADLAEWPADLRIQQFPTGF